MFQLPPSYPTGLLSQIFTAAFIGCCCGEEWLYACDYQRSVDLQSSTELLRCMSRPYLLINTVWEYYWSQRKASGCPNINLAGKVRISCRVKFVPEVVTIWPGQIWS